MNYVTHNSQRARMRSAAATMADDKWTESVGSLKGVILDMCGVLYDSGEGGGVPIEGSVEAVRR